jgi:membrane-associated protease RseP (regulator of RpoE activity)
MYFWGVAHSRIIPIDGGAGGISLGESIVLKIIEHFATGPIPDGMDIELSPFAFAAWAGMFVTMINLLPVGQLDGGHVAYALLGTKQDRAAVIVHRSMLAFFFVSLASYLARDLRAGMGLYRIGQHVNNSLFWLVWFEVVAVLGTLASRGKPQADDSQGETLTIRRRLAATVALALLAGVAREKATPGIWIAWFVGLGVLLAMEVRGGALRRHALFDHPPAGAAPLGRVRVAVAIVTLALFALLFMPTPISM